jgi:hypothetical protein
MHQPWRFFENPLWRAELVQAEKAHILETEARVCVSNQPCLALGVHRNPNKNVKSEFGRDAQRG